MIELKRILAPTDFSEFSEHALRYGCEFAAQFGAELHLLAVVDDSTPLMLDPEFMPVEDLVERLLLDRIEAHLAAGGIEHRPERRDPLRRCVGCTSIRSSSSAGTCPCSRADGGLSWVETVRQRVAAISAAPNTPNIAVKRSRWMIPSSTRNEWS